jgi:hypothetical protein
MNTISTEGYDVEECPPVTSTDGWNGEEWPQASLTAAVWEVELIPCPEFNPPPFDPSRDGIMDAARRHDALARRNYVKPFKWFKFNRARRATAK